MLLVVFLSELKLLLCVSHNGTWDCSKDKGKKPIWFGTDCVRDVTPQIAFQCAFMFCLDCGNKSFFSLVSPFSYSIQHECIRRYVYQLGCPLFSIKTRQSASLRYLLSVCLQHQPQPTLQTLAATRSAAANGRLTLTRSRWAQPTTRHRRPSRRMISGV